MNEKNRKAFQDMGTASTEIVRELESIGTAGALFMPVTDGDTVEKQFIRQTLGVVAKMAALQQAMLLSIESMAKAAERPPRKATPRQAATAREKRL